MPVRYEPTLRPRAIAFLDQCGDDEKKLILALVDQVADDPERDEETKISLVLPPAVLGVYVGHPDYWIVYSHYTKQGRPVLSVLNIARPSANSKPRP